ncbi:MAG: hypothetical protein JXR49_00240 [Acidobacteria bacterium]|nr:hypothetical protein [Acidobacteriota bacterium]
MPVTYRYDEEKNALMTYPTGLLAIGEITEYFIRASEDDAVAEGFVEVVHFDSVDDFEIRYSNAQVISDAYRQYMLAKKCRGTIFIAGNPVGFGIARMLGAVFEGFAVLRVLSTEDELEEELKRFNEASL